MGAEGTEPHRSKRSLAIEVLRIVAIAGIAVFHTFQPWFEQYAAGTYAPASFGAVATRPALVFALGAISLLGAYGNHAFYMISGYFLVPAAARSAGDAPYWGPQAKRCLRRALPILVSVAFYALVMLAVDALAVDLDRVSLSKAGWIVGGLQFIWVYLALAVLAPVIGWVWRRLPHRIAVTCAVLACLYAINAYIAFVSPGEAERGLLEWRKLMSAATYLGTFVAGAALRDVLDRARADAGLAARLPHLASCALAAAIGVSAAAECIAAIPGNQGLVVALSYKSTSLLSFLLAVTSLAFAATRTGRRLESAPAPVGRALLAATGSTLGFYIAQSMSTELWHPAMDSLLAAALGTHTAPWAAFLAAGTVASLAFVAALLVADALVRGTLFRRIGL